MIVCRTTAELLSWRNSQARDAQIGFVPTMGALHEGHATLLRTSVSENDTTVLSIFVNPTQFAPNEDLSKYPRTIERDLEMAKSAGVAAVYLPTAEDLYPSGYSTYVTENDLSKVLCGQYRPTHYQGVTTIVLKLFNLVRPNRAYFGMKDAQQFYVIQKMLVDLNLDQTIQVIGVETVREETGLALSSRNTYLTETERTQSAPKLFATLNRAAERIAGGAVPADCFKQATTELTQAGFEVQYLELRQNRLYVAAYFGAARVRLIDNVRV